MKTRLCLLFATLCLLAAPAFAESATALRGRMEQRLPQIDALKAQEVLGENNRGLLEERKSGTPGASTIVSDENRDRGAVYALLAAQTGATPESVARARAKQIAANSRPGVWVQDESGQWIRK
ncbi:MAG: YdbL family protein [Lacunisphaera sp.]|nr:YdbL family protein [Lacunisphaera sp.]